MSLFKMGVAVPIKNHQFRKGTNVYAEVGTGGYSSASPTTDIGIANTTTNIKYICGTGDIITIGPSTHADNSGAIQRLELSSLTATTMTFTENIIYSFTEGDPITGIGNYFPQGWTFTDVSGMTQGTNLITYNLNRLYNKSETTSDNGCDDFHALKIYWGIPVTYYPKFYQNIGTYLLGSTYYRLGYFYKVTWNQMNASTIIYTYIAQYTAPIEGSGISSALLANELLSTSGNILSWTEQTCTAFTTGTTTRTNLDLMKIIIRNNSWTGTFYIDNIYLEHAKGTDDAADGVFTFDDYPNAGSQKWSSSTGEKDVVLQNNRLKRIVSTGQVAPKWTFSCSFENVSISFYNQLLILHQWQRMGNMLTFHTNETPGGSLPPVMVGYMDIPEPSQLLWHLGKVTFNFQFIEAY